MIQRIQTIYLLLAFVLNGLTVIAPLWRFVEAEQAERIQGFQYLLQNDAFSVMIDAPSILRTQLFFQHEELGRQIGHWSLVCLIGLACLLTFINIFRYKKRPAQLRTNRFIIALIWLEIAAVVWLIFQPPVFLASASMTWDYGGIFPLLALLFLWLANRGISRDEKLVRSVDRIR